MQILKAILTCLLLSLGLTGFSQNTDKVFLKWNLHPGETLSYKTKMEAEKNAGQTGLSFGKLLNGAPDSIQKKMSDLTRRMAAEYENLVTDLSEKKKGIINIEMHSSKSSSDALKSPTDSLHENGFEMLINKMSGGMFLRGAITELGTIQSFYTRNDQKNLIALFFELPGKPVKVGERWSINTNFIAMDQNFKCDSSYKKNEVALVAIDVKNGEHLAKLKYDIKEYVSGEFGSLFGSGPIVTTMEVEFHGTAVFSVDQGRWISYEGIMSTDNSGIMSSNGTSKYSLIPRN